VSARYDVHVERLRASLPEPRPEFRAYASLVRDRPTAVTDADIEALRHAGFSEDEIFEQTVAAAVQAGLDRLDAALRALV
jgi:alkylhydroperoxidase family enzyme